MTHPVSQNTNLPHVSYYAFLAMPLAFAGLPLYMHIPDYYTRDLGLSLASAGIILMALRLLDAIQDPLIGYFSDKSISLRNSIIKIGMIALLIGMGCLIFGPPENIPIGYWFGFMIALTAAGLSMVNINFVMIGSIFQKSEQQRQTTSSWRESFGLAGMLIASILPPVIALIYKPALALDVFFFAFCVLLTLSAWGFFYFIKSIQSESDRRKEKNSISLRFLKNNARFIVACFLTQIAAALPAVLFLYFVKDYIGAPSYTGLLLFVYFASGATFMPLWLRIAHRSSAEKSWLIACILSIATFAGAATLSPGDIIQYGLICALSGMALGADLVFPPVIMGRILQRQNGISFASQAFSILNASPKIALAVASGLSFLILYEAGFNPGKANSEQASFTLLTLYALVPCAIKAIATFMIYQLYHGAKNEFQEGSSHHGHTHTA